MAIMSSRDRLLKAMRNSVPDRVPVTPDISNYIPCKHTGLAFWDIYFLKKYPLWRAYIEAANYYKIDPWVASCCEIPLQQENSNVDVRTEFAKDKNDNFMVQKITYRTPDGDLEEENICYRFEPPTHLSRMIKDLNSDWRRYKWLLTPPTGVDLSLINEIRKECEYHEIAFGLYIEYPGFQAWEGLVQGSIEQLTYVYMDNPAILDEWFEIQLEGGTVAMELYLSTRPDYVLFGGSGTLTLASPQLVMRYAIPAIKRWSQMARKARVASMLHSCGKSKLLVDMLVEHTMVDCVNPLEGPPMGDIDLAELKLIHGRQIALMGNLHTTDIMLKGTSRQVYEASVQAISEAGDRGGFILSTGDQCGLYTPEKNILAMVRAAEEYGYYDTDTGTLHDLA